MVIKPKGVNRNRFERTEISNIPFEMDRARSDKRRDSWPFNSPSSIQSESSSCSSTFSPFGKYYFINTRDDNALLVHWTLG